LKLIRSNPSKFLISKKSDSRIALLENNASGLFSDGLKRQKPTHLALPQTHPTLFEKIQRGGFELNETQTNPEC